MSPDSADVELDLRRRARAALTACHAFGRTGAALREARQAFVQHSVADALRVIDRAWRTLPAGAAALAPIYAWLLVIEDRDPEAALGILQQAKAQSPSADIAALTMITLLRRGQVPDAVQELHAALTSFCVEPAGLLAAVANVLVMKSGVVGWWGWSRRLDIVGAVDRAKTCIEVRVDQAVHYTAVSSETEDHLRSFRTRVPGRFIDQPVQVMTGNEVLLGAAHLPQDFGLEGNIELSRSRLRGIARLRWNPKRRLRIEVSDEYGNRIHVHGAASTGAFAVALTASGLVGARLTVAVKLPSGRWAALLDSPLLRQAALGGSVRRRLGRWRDPPFLPYRKRSRPGEVTVIVPVFNQYEETLACLASVRASLPSWGRLLVIDDASTDAALATALDDLGRDERVTLLRNESNNGFVASVNRGLAACHGGDVVLLNSDTRVFGDWLRRLRTAAYSDERVATVTPLGNNASIASYPRAAGDRLNPADAEVLDAFAARNLRRRRVAIPVGVGFCMYLRRDGLDAVGAFDEAVFGAGYGEECDYCLRARRRGFIHLLAADVFVHHAGGSSFGGRRTALLARSSRLLNLRYPGYDAHIASFLEASALPHLRREFDERRLQTLSGRCVILVSLALEGGVERHIQERSAQLRSAGLFPLVLRPKNSQLPGECELRSEAMDVSNLNYQTPRELPRLAALLKRLQPAGVEIHHFLGHHPRLIEAMLRLPCSYDVVIHDYVWICPRVTLIDGSGRYCGEPPVSTCRICIRENGAALKAPASVTTLRARSHRWLAGARRVIAPSADVAQRLRRYFDIEVTVRPHSQVLRRQLRPLSAHGRSVVRVALIGAIGTHKGCDVLLACARDARRRSLPIKFIVIGYTSDDARLLATERVFITGRYTDAEVPYLLSRERPDLIWLPSVWPETWCYALDHALASGLPIASFALGALAERLRGVDRTELLPLTLHANEINDRLLEFAVSPPMAVSDRSSISAADDLGTAIPVPALPYPPHSLSDTADQVASLNVAVQILNLSPGLHLLSLVRGSPATRPTPVLPLPAVHVAPAPGTDAAAVEFVNGSGLPSEWLTVQRGILAVRTSHGASLAVTCVGEARGELPGVGVVRLGAAGSKTAAVAVGARSEARTDPFSDQTSET